MENLFIECGHASVNKQGETLCGDSYCIKKAGDKLTIVLSDGLGSGVKANILSTFTAIILSTLMSRKLPKKNALRLWLPPCLCAGSASWRIPLLPWPRSKARRRAWYNMITPMPFCSEMGKMWSIPPMCILLGKRDSRK